MTGDAIVFDIYLIMYIVAGACLAMTALLALWRIITGPSILDRMVATDVLVTTLMLVGGADMIIRNHTDTLILLLILGATSVFGTILVAQNVRGSVIHQTSSGGEPRV